ncbi:myosin-11-like isoform X2 [Hylaeus volcanicus]|uniref:myosin-11-like isoform X2 n=1 Tax=Hylaeus volcanicus TaxID=313075 RepID=UPI0023B87E94|nr:myosin-11-like isoform X2 [Hylaeus volcanicus]
MNSSDTPICSKMNHNVAEYPHLLDTSVYSSQSSTLDDIFQNLKSQRQEIESWKLQRKLSLPFQQNLISHTSKNELDSADLKYEIQRLKVALKRYQQADPNVDFVHKDFLKEKNNIIELLESKNKQIFKERDELIKDLETSKWYNSTILSERDIAYGELENCKRKIADANEQLEHKENLCAQYLYNQKILETKIEEFNKRHQKLDFHIMEIGEQKTSFLKGISERQVQFDFLSKKVKQTEKALLDKEKEYFEICEKSQNLAQQLDVSNQELKETQENLNTQLVLIENLKMKLQSMETRLESFQKKQKEKQEQMSRMKDLSQKQRSFILKIIQMILSYTLGEDTYEIKTATNEFVKLKDEDNFLDFNLMENALNKVIKKIKDKFDALGKELEKKKNDIQNTEDECSTSKGQANLLDVEIENLKRALEYEENQNEVLMRENENLINLQEHQKDIIQKFEQCEIDYELKLNQNSDQIQSLTNKLEHELREKRRIKFGLRFAESKVADRRISIGWGPVSTVRVYDLKMIKGFNVNILLDKKNPKTFLFNKTEHKLDIQVIQLSPDRKSLYLSRDHKPFTQTDKIEKVISFQSIVLCEYGYTSSSLSWEKLVKSSPLLCQQDGHPIYWRCISLYTVQKVYNFLCHTDEEAEAMLLVIAHYSPNSIGIKSRQEFIFRKVKLKLQEHCRRRGIQLKQLFLEAIRRSLVTSPNFSRRLSKITRHSLNAFEKKTKSKTKQPVITSRSDGITNDHTSDDTLQESLSNKKVSIRLNNNSYNSNQQDALLDKQERLPPNYYNNTFPDTPDEFSNSIQNVSHNSSPKQAMHLLTQTVKEKKTAAFSQKKKSIEEPKGNKIVMKPFKHTVSKPPIAKKKAEFIVTS